MTRVGGPSPVNFIFKAGKQTDEVVELIIQFGRLWNKEIF